MDPYEILKQRHPCKKRNVLAEIVVVLSNKRDDRGLMLISPYTRAVRAQEIHEFIITDEENILPASTVDRVAYLCFAEILKGGVIMVGEQISIGDQTIGQVVGFDESHMPNHLNVVIHAPERKSGFECDITVGQQMRITDKY